MKRMMFLITAILALGLLLGGCKKEQKADPAQPAANEEPKQEPKPAVDEAKAEVKKDETKTETKTETAATGDAERDCGALHDMMKQMIDAMKAKLGKGAQPKKEFPPKDKFVAACKELPSNVIRCMNPQVAMKEGAKCQQVMMNADKAAIAKFKTMLR